MISIRPPFFPEEAVGCILETTDCLLWEEGRSDGYHALPNAEGQDPGDVLQLVLLLLHALRHCPQLAGPYWNSLHQFPHCGNPRCPWQAFGSCCLYMDGSAIPVHRPQLLC